MNKRNVRIRHPKFCHLLEAQESTLSVRWGRLCIAGRQLQRLFRFHVLEKAFLINTAISAMLK